MDNNLEDLVVVEVETLLQVEQETPHQHHHLKEILEVLELLPVNLMEVLVVEVQVRLDLMLQMEEVVMEQQTALLEHR
jgi:hypothetical protein